MRAHPWLFVAAAALLTGCAERSTPTEPATTVPAVRLNQQAGTTPGAVQTFTIRLKKNSKSYHVKLDKMTRTMEFTTPAFQCSDPEDPACEPEPCDPTAEYCNTAEFIDEELDNGQIGIGDVSNVSEGAPCPETIDGGIWFSWRRHNFVVWGVHKRQRVLKTWPWGEAEYALPPGPHESDDGRAVIWNGVVRGKCFGYTSRSGEFNGIHRDDLGPR